MLYHVTPARNLESILQNGLIPQIGATAALYGESTKNVYLFTSSEACETGLWNEMSEALEDEDDIAILEFADGSIKGDTTAVWELACPHIIPADLIVRVLRENDLQGPLKKIPPPVTK